MEQPEGFKIGSNGHYYGDMNTKEFEEHTVLDLNIVYDKK